MEGIVTKKCSKCGVEKPLIEFSKQSSKKNGIRPSCKNCEREYRTKNSERIKLLKAIKYQENKSLFIERFEKYKERFPEKLRANQKSYRERHKEEIKSYRIKE